MYYRYLLCLLLFSLPVHAEPANTKAQNKPVILTSIQPLGLLAKAVAGDKAEVRVLLSGRASAHHYALSLSDRRDIASADLVLWVGKAIETFLEKPLAQRRAGVITTMDLSGLQWPEHNDHHDDHHHLDDRDPHIWLNPLNDIVVVNHLVEQLIAIAPQYAHDYQKNADQLNAALRQLDDRLQASMGPLQAEPFIVAHPAYNHFIGRYGLHQQHFIAVTPERQAGAKHLYQLRQLQAQCVFVDKGVSSDSAVRLAADLGIEMYSLNPLGLGIELASDTQGQRGIVQLIEQLAQSFEDCLIQKE